MRHLSAHCLLSNCQHVFRKNPSTRYLLAFLAKSWLTSFRDLGETFPVGFISKAFDRLWHKSSISKLSSYRLYHCLCASISNLVYDRFLAATVDGHSSSPKTINSRVPWGFVLSPILFLLFINYLLNLTRCLINSYVDYTTLQFSTSHNTRPTQQEINDARRDAISRLTSDLSLAFDWGRANLILINASKLNFYNYLLDITCQITIPSSSRILNFPSSLY